MKEKQKVQSTVEPLEHAKPLIRAVYWHLHELLLESVTSEFPEGWTVVPAFHTRLSCIADPNVFSDELARDNVLDATIDYLLLAVRTPRGGQDVWAPVPLFAIDLSGSRRRRHSFPNTMKSLGVAYARLDDSEYEDAPKVVADLARSVDVAQRLRVASAVPSAPLDNGRAAAREFLHMEERKLFRAMLRAAQQYGLMVMGQPSLSEVMNLQDGSPVFRQLRQRQNYDNWKFMMRYLRRHPVDYALCSPAPYALPLVLLALDGHEKQRKDPILAARKERDQNEAVLASGLTLCRVKWDLRKGWNWPQAELDALANVLARQGRRAMGSERIRKVMAERLTEPLRELAVGGQSRAQTARDLVYLIRYQLSYVQRLEKRLEDLSEQVETDQRYWDQRFAEEEANGQFALDEAMQDDVEAGMELFEYQSRGTTPTLSALGLELHTWVAPDSFSLESALWAEMRWKEKEGHSDVALPEAKFAPIKVNFVGAWQVELREAYIQSLVRELTVRLYRSTKPLLEDLLRARSKATADRVWSIRRRGISKIIESSRTEIKGVWRAETLLPKRMQRDISARLSIQEREKMAGLWREELSKWQWPENVLLEFLKELARLCGLPLAPTPPLPPLVRQALDKC